MNGYLFVCPRCKKGSNNADDADDGYCGECHAQTGIPVGLTIGPAIAIIGYLDLDPSEPIASKLASLINDHTYEGPWLYVLDDFYRRKWEERPDHER